MDPRTGRRKPRLERRNAAKNYDYDAPSFSSSQDDSSSSSSSLRTRSLELSDRTSFRIEGNDGEFDRICRSLGLTGIEDFAIPAAAWEARKIRSSSDLTPRSRLNPFNSPKEGNEGAAAELERDASAQVSKEVASRIKDRDRDSRGIREVAVLARSNSPELTPSVLTGSTPFSGGARELGGIKGTRPPLLKPPPSMTLQVRDDTLSTWELLRDFAPPGERDDVVPSSDEEEDEEPVDVKGDEAEEEESLFTDSKEDDGSSSTTDPTSISPNVRYRRTITVWEKGELLGRGSFGSVYEGISE